MELNINSPAYYSRKFGVDDEVYWFCRKIAKFAKDKNYSEIVDTIGVMTCVAPKEVLNNTPWKKDILEHLEYTEEDLENI